MTNWLLPQDIIIIPQHILILHHDRLTVGPMGQPGAMCEYIDEVIISEDDNPNTLRQC